MALWNPWHGCEKYSAGCMHCYVYRTDSRFDKDSSKVTKNSDFDLPLRLSRDGTYKLQPDGEPVYTCFTSDFFLDKADHWRGECWDMIYRRPDLDFLIITKRILRFNDCIPDNWGEGYGNVTICCTVENNEVAKKRLPVFLSAKIRHKMIICEPLLSSIELSPYLTHEIEGVICGGESGNEARICDFDWVLDIRAQCEKAGVPFHFKQTGANFKKDGKIYRIPRKFQHSQAKKADIDLK